MDDLDRALLDAWNRLAPKVRRDRLEAARRAARRSSATLTRPVRAWCLCLRAADSRLDTYAAVAPYAALRTNEPHTLYIDAPTIRRLVAPITIPWPGLRLRVAARRLGRDTRSVHSWLKRGVFEVTYEAATIHSHFGRPVPVVWTPSPLDPNANFGRAPDPVWGSMWQYRHTRVPDDLTLIVNREMTYRYDRRRRRKDLGSARGWQFICPGRPSTGGQAASGTMSTGGHAASGTVGRVRVVDGQPMWPQDPEDHPPITCGRTARRLFCPLPVIDLPGMLGEDPLAEVEARGLERPRPAPHCPAPLFFACAHCHGIASDSLRANGWNACIARLSRGLLYGHEVERPSAHEYKRKRRYSPHNRLAPRRDRVLALLLRGLTRAEIAAELGMALSSLDKHAKAIYRAHNVRSRAGLCRELGVTLPRTPARALAEARDVLLEGLTYEQAAERLGLAVKTFGARVTRLYKFYGARSRADLRERLKQIGHPVPAAPLSDKLAEARDLLVEGLTFREAAERLGIQVKTFDARVRRLYRHYGVHSRGELRERVAQLDRKSREPGPAAPANERVPV